MADLVEFPKGPRTTFVEEPVVVICTALRAERGEGPCLRCPSPGPTRYDEALHPCRVKAERLTEAIGSALVKDESFIGYVQKLMDEHFARNPDAVG